MKNQTIVALIQRYGLKEQLSTSEEEENGSLQGQNVIKYKGNVVFVILSSLALF